MGRREIPEINAGSMADIAFLLLIFFLVTTTISVPEAGQPVTLPIKVEKPEFEIDPAPILDRNVLFIKANKNNNLLIDKEEFLSAAEVEKLYDMTIKFYGDHTGSQSIDADGRAVSAEEADYPIREEVKLTGIEADIEMWEKNLEAYEANGLDSRYAKAMLKRANKKKEVFLEIGTYYELPKMSLIKFESDNGTSYGFYLTALDQMKSALQDLRNKYSQANYGKDYDELDKELDANAIKIIDYLYPNKIIDSSDK